MQFTLRFLIGSGIFLAQAAMLHAQVKIEQDAANALIAPDASIKKLAGDLKFTEGPVWLKDKSVLIFSDIPASKLMQWSADGGLREYRAVEAANGNTVDGSGRLVSCQHAGRNIVREEKDGTISVVVADFEGKKFHSPNDLAIKSDGTIWFTDPSYGLPKGAAKEIDGHWVYRFDPKTKKTTVVNREFDMPNGFAFSPHEKRLYIADSGRKQRVGAFPVNADGTLGPALYWMEGGADGIRCDEKGNLYTTAGDGVRIYDPAGVRLATIKLPEVPANCGFGGADGRTLFVTARTSLYSVPLKIAGKEWIK